MPQEEAPKIVTLDEGDGPVKVVKDTSGRILTKDQLQLIRDRQQAELDKATGLHDKLAAGDEAAVTQITGQVKDQMVSRLGLLKRQQEELDQKQAALEAGDATAVEEVVGQMVKRLAGRIERLTAVRDRFDALLAGL